MIVNAKDSNEIFAEASRVYVVAEVGSGACGEEEADAASSGRAPLGVPGWPPARIGGGGCQEGGPRRGFARAEDVLFAWAMSTDERPGMLRR